MRINVNIQNGEKLFGCISCSKCSFINSESCKGGRKNFDWIRNVHYMNFISRKILEEQFLVCSVACFNLYSVYLFVYVVKECISSKKGNCYTALPWYFVGNTKLVEKFAERK